MAEATVALRIMMAAVAAIMEITLAVTAAIGMVAMAIMTEGIINPFFLRAFSSLAAALSQNRQT